jgi:CRP-like cAMP-binding protein
MSGQMREATPNALAASLRRAPIFAKLATPLLARLAQRASLRRYEQGSVVFLEGETLAGLYYLEFGWLKLIKMSMDGRELVWQVLGPGEFINYLGMFGQRPSPTTAIALEPIGLWLLPCNAFDEARAADPDMAVYVIEAMGERIANLVQLLSDLSLHTVEARLARHLLAEAKDKDVVDQYDWDTRAHLAAQLGTVPDVLSRVLRSLAEEGLIEIERRRIHIVDVEGLAAKALVVK